MLRVEDAEFDLQDGADNAREYLGSFTSSQWSDLSNDEPGPIVIKKNDHTCLKYSIFIYFPSSFLPPCVYWQGLMLLVAARNMYQPWHACTKLHCGSGGWHISWGLTWLICGLSCCLYGRSRSHAREGPLGLPSTAGL